MISDTWDLKDDAKALDVEGFQVGKQSPDVTTPGHQGLWTPTSRRELWSFYLYYVVRRARVATITLRFLTSIKGNNGLSGFNFGPSQFQNLLYLAGYDPSHPPFTAPCGSNTECVLPYLGAVRNSKASLSSRDDHRGRSLLLIIGDHSQLDRSPHQWYQLRHSGGFVVDDWWMGRLRDVEVREDLALKCELR